MKKLFYDMLNVKGVYTLFIPCLSLSIAHFRNVLVLVKMFIKLRN